MSYFTVIPETQLSTFPSSSSLCPGPSSLSSPQGAVGESPEPNTQQPSMLEMDGGNDQGSGSESDLSDLESESSCSELAVSSRTQSTEPRVSSESTSGASPTISYYNLPSARTCTIVYALRHHAAWSYSQLQHEFNIPLNTLHRIIHGERDAEKKKPLSLPWPPPCY